MGAVLGEKSFAAVLAEMPSRIILLLTLILPK